MCSHVQDNYVYTCLQREREGAMKLYNVVGFVYCGINEKMACFMHTCKTLTKQLDWY